MAERHTVTVGLVDNDPLVLTALETMLRDEGTPLNVLWTVLGAQDALALCMRSSTRPRVVVTDMQMPGMDGSELASRLHEHEEWRISVIGLTAFHDRYDRAELAQSGLTRILFKEISAEGLVHEIGQEIGDAALKKWTRTKPSLAQMVLTGDEKTVLKLFLNGYTVPVIAARMHISEGTVKNRMWSAYAKLGVHNRSQAILRCVQQGLL